MIESFKKKELKNKLALQTKASAWREAMYTALTRKTGVDPRGTFEQDLRTTRGQAAADTANREAAGKAVGARAGRQSARAAKSEREQPLAARIAVDKAAAEAAEADYLAKPWRHGAGATVSARAAVGETVILLHRPFPLVGVSTWMERGVSTITVSPTARFESRRAGAPGSG